MPVVVTGERNGLLSRIYDNPKYNAAFDRCIDVMAKLMQKYGTQVLKQQGADISSSMPEQPDTEQSSSFSNAA